MKIVVVPISVALGWMGANKILYIKHLAPYLADINDSINAIIIISLCILRF